MHPQKMGGCPTEPNLFKVAGFVRSYSNAPLPLHEFLSWELSTGGTKGVHPVDEHILYPPYN